VTENNFIGIKTFFSAFSVSCFSSCFSCAIDALKKSTENKLKTAANILFMLFVIIPNPDFGAKIRLERGN